MDNVLNRPLFRHREARDRLNDIAGVQRFQEGGPVFERIGRQPVRPAGLPSIAPAETLSYTDLVKKARQGGQVTYEDYLNFLSNDSVTTQQAQDVLAMVEQPGYVPSELDRLFVRPKIVPNPKDSRFTRGIRGITDYLLGVFGGQTVGEAEQVRQDRVREEQEYQDYLAAGGFEGALQRMQQEEEAMFGNLDRAAENAAPSGVGGARPEAPAAGMPAARPAEVPAERSPMEADARDRGPMITDPAAVAAGLNAEDPEVRDRTVADFMKEFTDVAPEYEGANKNLMLAQIGFAIAAGESPNAMQNIANGLLAGSDMMLKDKAAKAEFDRSVKLSAMEYGLQQAGNQRSRDEEFLNFVALEDTVYKGRKVKAGQAVYIPFGEIKKNGGVVPEGFGDSSMVTALNERAIRAFEIIEKDREERLIDDTVANTLRKEFGESADRAVSAQRGIDYMESALITIAEGGVVGLKGSANQVIKDGLALFGIEAATQFSRREEALALVAKGFQNLIPVAFSGTQTGNSISNFDVQQLANAYVDAMLKDGVFSLANVTEEKLNNSLKGALELLESGRQSALTNMNGIERQLTGRKLRSGVDATSIVQPSRERIPQEEDIEVPSVLGSLYRSEDGVYRLRLSGG